MPVNRSLNLAVAAASLTLALAATSDARIRQRDLEDSHKDYTQRGVQIYAGFGAQEYEVEDIDYADLDQLDDGGAFFFGVGLGLDRGVSLYFEGTASEHPTLTGDVVFGTGMIGVKYAPNSGHRHLWQPYGKFALGGMFLFEDESPYKFRDRHDDDNGYMGPAVGIALGIDHFIGRRTAIFGEIGLTSGQLDTRVIDDEEFDLVDDIDVTSGRIQFGLRFRL
jgi:hypothetical protein